MDRITRSYLTEFNSNFFEKTTKEDVLFEHFVNYIILERKIDENITDEIIEKLNIGSDNTIGLDGFAIIINGHHITEIEDMDLILDKNKKSIAEVFFIQSKTSSKFENKEVPIWRSFATSAHLVLSTKQSVCNAVRLFE